MKRNEGYFEIEETHFKAMKHLFFLLFFPPPRSMFLSWGENCASSEVNEPHSVSEIFQFLWKNYVSEDYARRQASIN